MTDDVRTTHRGRMSPSRRLRIYEAHKGLCCLCGLKIEAGQKWIVEHLRALELGGEDAESNMAPAHESCAIEKTRGDHHRAAKAKRVKARHIGIRKRKGPPIPGSRDSGWKRKMDGTLIRRDQ